MSKTPVIAIDGPAASGKGTLARRLAEHLGYDYLDTGAIYRATARDTLRGGGNLADADEAASYAARLDPSTLDDPALKGEEAGKGASVVAAHPPVREALLVFQRNFASHPLGGRGAILDGRDIGTVICPDAPVKLYVMASPEVRAHRRYLEEVARGLPADETRILAEVRERDARDSGRTTAPLKPADDAIMLDTSAMSAAEVFREALRLVSQALR